MTDTATREPAGSRDEHGNLTCQVYRGGKPASTPHLHEISEILNEEGTLVWFDIVDPTAEDLHLLQEEFDLHPLAIEDAVLAHERPKIEDYSSYWFLVIEATTLEEGQVEFHEIAIFAGEKFVVTVRHQPAYPLGEIEKRWHAHPERLRGSAGFLLYTILDTVVDGYFPVVDAFEDEVDGMERALFEDHPLEGNVLRRIFGMKQEGTNFRRAAVPMRDILTPIIRGDVNLFPEDELVYLRDVYDHAVRVIDQIDTLRDMLSTALDIHLSIVANRQNEVVRQLTAMATIFLPLSFIVGFFGQNFSFLVGHIQGEGAFWLLAIGTEVVAVLVMAMYFRRKRWL